MNERSFQQDVEFLDQFVSTVVLGQPGGPQVVLVPEYQGRTMTCTAGTGKSYAWINYDLIASGKKVSQINLYGGEDRFWLGPEGGQFSLFFDPGASMDFADWRVPAILDTEPFEMTEVANDHARFQKSAKVRNYSGFVFEIRFDRTVELVGTAEAEGFLGTSLDGTNWICHQSSNELTNVGQAAWTPETGLLGIWMLCMNKPSPRATVVIPFKPGPTGELGPVVNADYFGKLDESRLKIDHEHHLIYFLGDGSLRSKLGLSFARVRSYLGSWDPRLETLTIVQFNLPDHVDHGYTNNVWEIQQDPFAGDVINSYNDGPNETGGMLGPFFELETLSPALALQPRESYVHVNRTFRVEGPRDSLSRICESVFGVSLVDIEQRFSGA